MNKLGFYIHNSTVPSLRDALRKVQPTTILMHAGDRSLMHGIRRDLSPNSSTISAMRPRGSMTSCSLTPG